MDLFAIRDGNGLIAIDWNTPPDPADFKWENESEISNRLTPIIGRLSASRVIEWMRREHPHKMVYMRIRTEAAIENQNAVRTFLEYPLPHPDLEPQDLADRTTLPLTPYIVESVRGAARWHNIPPEGFDEWFAFIIGVGLGHYGANRRREER